jgi:hypothetical protein
MAIIPLIFNFRLCVKALFVMNIYAISKNTKNISTMYSLGELGSSLEITF